MYSCSAFIINRAEGTSFPSPDTRNGHDHCCMSQIKASKTITVVCTRLCCIALMSCQVDRPLASWWMAVLDRCTQCTQSMDKRPLLLHQVGSARHKSVVTFKFKLQWVVQTCEMICKHFCKHVVKRDRLTLAFPVKDVEWQGSLPFNRGVKHVVAGLTTDDVVEGFQRQCKVFA